MSNTEKTIADIALNESEVKVEQDVPTVDVVVNEVVEETVEAVKEVAPKVEPKKVESKKVEPKQVEPKQEVTEPSFVEPKKVSRYVPGYYRADKYLRIIKKLSYKNIVDSKGNIQKTYGTWATAGNMIEFKKGQETYLSEEDLTLPAIQRLIDTKVILRIG